MNTETAPQSGKAMKEAAEAAYDDLAKEHGIDEHGDEIPVDDDVEDDGPLLEGEDEDNDGDDDQPVVDEADDDEPGESEGDSEDQEAEEPAAAEAAGDDDLAAPHTWKQEWKDAYDQIKSPEVRKAIHELSGHMNRAFTQRMTQLSDTRKEFQNMERVITPHAERLQRAGMTPEMAIGRALGWDAHISADPVQGWLDYGKALGINPNEAIKTQVDETRFMTPTERTMMEQNQTLAQRLEANESRLGQYLAEQQQRDTATRTANAEQTLQTFMNAKDDAGNLLHPHVEMVAGVMTRLIDGNVADDLDQAYEMAAVTHPTIKAARAKTRKATQVRGAQVKAAQVRKASKSGIVGKGGGKAPKAAKSFEDRALENYDKIANG